MMIQIISLVKLTQLIIFLVILMWILKMIMNVDMDYTSH